MKQSKARIGVVVALLVAGSWGCGNADDNGAAASTGGSGGQSHGSGGSGGAPRGTGGATTSGGTSGAGTGGADGNNDAGAGETEVAGDSNEPADTGEPGMAADGGTAPDSGGGVAVCWADPKVIMICHQLENACINCAPGGNPPKNQTAVACFELIKKAYAGMATDADCVAFATSHSCKPDDATTTGNVCGGLNCQVAGCKDPAKCEVVKQDGESDKCQPYVATCPCK